MKWYKKVMFHVFDLAELQSYLLYRMKSEKHVPHMVYQRELIKQMPPTCKIHLIGSLAINDLQDPYLICIG